MIANDKVLLLADAEVGEDGVEDVVGGDLASDLADVVEDAANVLAKKVAAKGVIHRRAGIHKCCVGTLKCRIVAHIRNDDAPCIKATRVDNIT